MPATPARGETANRLAIRIYRSAFQAATEFGIDDPEAVLDGTMVALATMASAMQLHPDRFEQLVLQLRRARDVLDGKPPAAPGRPVLRVVQ